MLTSKFCVVVNKCPTYSSNSPFQGFSAAYAATILALCCAVQCSFVNKCPTYKLEFAFSRLLRSLRCYNSRFMLCSPMFVREQMSNIQARIRLFKASPQLTLLQFSLYVVQPNVHLKSRMQACRFASSIVFFCSLKKRP